MRGEEEGGQRQTYRSLSGRCLYVQIKMSKLEFLLPWWNVIARSNLGRSGSLDLQINSLSVKEIRVRTQDRNRGRAILERGCLLSQLSYIPQGLLTRSGIPNGGMGSLTSIINPENTPIDFPTGQLIEVLSLRGGSSSQITSLCQLDQNSNRDARGHPQVSIIRSHWPLFLETR